jgi:hypothetical protein
MAHWPPSAGASPHFALAVQRAIPLGSPLTQTLGLRGTTEVRRAGLNLRQYARTPESRWLSRRASDGRSVHAESVLQNGALHSTGAVMKASVLVVLVTLSGVSGLANANCWRYPNGQVQCTNANSTAPMVGHYQANPYAGQVAANAGRTVANGAVAAGGAGVMYFSPATGPAAPYAAAAGAGGVVLGVDALLSG